MSKLQNKRRWKVCKSCLANSEFNEAFRNDHLEWEARFSAHVEEGIADGANWYNSVSTVYSEYLGKHIVKNHWADDCNKLCPGCPFLLEHTVAAQKKVRE